MIRSIVISPDQELATRLETALAATGHVTVSRSLPSYPSATELTRSLRAQAPDLVFLSFESIEKAQEIVKILESEAEGTQIIAIHHKFDAGLLRETMRLGLREFLADPFERGAVIDALSHVKEMLARKPPVHQTTNQIFSFLPSKAGAGTSTIALNTSAAMARRGNMHVVLSDFDLNSGMLRFMLKLQNEYSVIDAVENAVRMDENLWPQLVTSLESLDVLHAGRVNPNLRIEPNQVHHLVDFMRRNYKAVCFDLSGNLERYSLELMQESKKVLLVCTPEIPSLHLAREKLHFLRSCELDTRVAVVLNRISKKPVFTKQQVEELLGVPVIMEFANDYHGVNRAMTAGTYVAPASEMGKAFIQFANELLDKKPTQPMEKRKFLEFFAVGNKTLAGSEK